MIKRYFIILGVSLAIDMFWHVFIARKLFQEEIGHLMGEKIKAYAGLIFYAINALAILFLVISPSLEKQDMIQALLHGGLLGFAMYATYNFTNLALLRDWSIKVTLLDLGWGTFAAGLTSLISSKIIQVFYL